MKKVMMMVTFVMISVFSLVTAASAETTCKVWKTSRSYVFYDSYGNEMASSMDEDVGGNPTFKGFEKTADYLRSIGSCDRIEMGVQHSVGQRGVDELSAFLNRPALNSGISTCERELDTASNHDPAQNTANTQLMKQVITLDAASRAEATLGSRAN
jgi:hypothetical protein